VGRAFFPLDQKLKLREDRWSEGAAHIATRTALRTSSFAKAAREYEEAVGGVISAMSVWRIVEHAGEKVAEKQAAMAQRAAAPAQRAERPGHRRLPVWEAVESVGNLSTDGGMIHLRAEGWKEVKITTVSQVDVEQDEETGEKTIRLGRHSYTAKLADADTFAAYQYAEGLRRGLDQVETLSSVNDGAVWIERITETNFPQAIQIVDWYHAKSRLHQVAQALWGEGQRSQQWLDQRLSELRQGKVNKLHRTLAALPLEHKGESVRSAPGYFQHNQMRMRYDRFRRQNLPIGSGSVESAVLHVVQHRMHRPGRGWNRSHAAGMLALLSEYHSDRLRHTWRHAVAA
jgi:hypothetical protein